MAHVKGAEHVVSQVVNGAMHTGEWHLSGDRLMQILTKCCGLNQLDHVQLL